MLTEMDLNLIEPNLYLGCRYAAEDVETLKKHNVTHILTIEDYPLPEEITQNQNFITKYIRLYDLPVEDLLSHFDDTYAFITDGLSKGVVLVHCLMGISRSATVVIAFIMKKYQLTYEEAFQKVAQMRTGIRPNSGFILQLKFYKDMGYKVDSEHIDYKLYILRIVAQQIYYQDEVSKNSVDVIAPDPELFSQAGPGPKLGGYCCSKCSRILAQESSSIIHKHKGKVCTKSVFVMPVAWMQFVTTATKNDLHCPTCNTKVGSFDWSEDGIQCECSFKISPAFCLRSPQVKTHSE